MFPRNYAIKSPETIQCNRRWSDYTNYLLKNKMGKCSPRSSNGNVPVKHFRLFFGEFSSGSSLQDFVHGLSVRVSSDR